MLNPDFRIVTATSGEQALAAVRADTPPDLILLGIPKPEMEGCDLCRRLKANQATRDIPLIGTARGMVYREDQTTLSKNDVLLLCSGGVTRARIGVENDFPKSD